VTDNAKSILINCVEILKRQNPNPPLVNIFLGTLPASSGVVTNVGNQSILFNAQNLVGMSIVEIPLRVCSQVCPNLCDSSKLFIHVNITDNATGIEVPKVFSFDASLTLPTLEINGLDAYPSNEMTIVDRWGATVFGPVTYKNKDEKKAWNGTKNGVHLPTGAYYYYIRYSENNLLKNKTGIIYLIDKQ
jgi:gliding motility-associated-like protein